MQKAGVAYLNPQRSRCETTVQSEKVEVCVGSSGGPAGAVGRLSTRGNIHIEGGAGVLKRLPLRQIRATRCLYRILRGSALVVFLFPRGGPTVCSVNWDIDSMRDGRPGERGLFRRDSI